MITRRLNDHTNDDLLFEFQLAEHLHMTHAQVRDMDNWELKAWNAYLLRKEQLEQLERQRQGR